MNAGRGPDWLLWVLGHGWVCWVLIVAVVVRDVVTGDFEGADE